MVWFGLWVEAQISEVNDKGKPVRTLERVLYDPRESRKKTTLNDLAKALGIPVRRQASA